MEHKLPTAVDFVELMRPEARELQSLPEGHPRRVQLERLIKAAARGYVRLVVETVRARRTVH